MRDDTFFGVCEGLGEDFGFNPLYLRVTLAFLLLWYPVATLAAYALGGVIVVIARFFFPVPRTARAPQPIAEQQAPADGEEPQPEYSVAA
jgi:phage shock protein PspC (stress-responsive transcriptional regulator)